MENDKFQELIMQQFNKVFEKLESLEKGQRKIESRMENEVIYKLGALFDAREVQNDRHNQILEMLSEMDDELDYALLKLTQHEIKLMAKKKLSPR